MCAEQLQLGEMGAAEAVTQLMKALEDKSENVRRSAAQALGKMDAAAADAADPVGQDQAGNAHKTSASSFGLGKVRSVPQLLTALEDPNDADVRRSAARALGKLGPAAAEAVPELVKALEDKDISVCGCASRALGQMGPAGAEPLIKALEDQHQDINVRTTMVFDLGEMRPAVADVVLQLIRMLSDTDLRHAAGSTLRRMGPVAAEALRSAALPWQSLRPLFARAYAQEKPPENSWLQIVSSVYQDSWDGEDRVDPVVVAAVQHAIWLSDDHDEVRCAVQWLPAILQASELSTFQQRGLVQRALRMVPDVVVEAKLHRLLETELPAGDLIDPTERDMSLPDASRADGFEVLSASTNSSVGIRASLSQLARSAPADADSLGSSEGAVLLGQYALQMLQSNAAAHSEDVCSGNESEGSEW